MAYEMLRRVGSLDGEFFVEFIRSDLGFYRFAEFKKDCDPGYDPFYWERYRSGIFDDLLEAEKEAARLYPWIAAGSVLTERPDRVAQ
mgnify:CR=1 FL=1